MKHCSNPDCKGRAIVPFVDLDGLPWCSMRCMDQHVKGEASGIMKIGDEVYLAHEIIEPADGDHPAFLMGAKGEKVKILDIDDRHPCLFIVEGPTNTGKPWRAYRNDLMFTKPFKGN